MTLLTFFAWWSLGFTASWLCVVLDVVLVDRKPITWGHLVLCLAGGFIGPVVWIFVVMFFLHALSYNAIPRMKWWNKPVGRKDGR